MNGQRQRNYVGSLRLPDYDYSQNGAYFVTLVTFKRQFLFGDIIKGKMVLNNIGEIVLNVWFEIPDHFVDVTNDLFVIMPNHVHGIVIIKSNLPANVAATHASQLPEDYVNGSIFQGELQGQVEDRGSSSSYRPRGPKPGSLGAIIGSFKAAASKRIHSMTGYETCKVWQRNYYEHIIRDEESLQRIVDYILSNPANWGVDPINVS